MHLNATSKKSFADKSAAFYPDGSRCRILMQFSETRNDPFFKDLQLLQCVVWGEKDSH